MPSTFHNQAPPVFTPEQEARVREVIAEILAERDAYLDKALNAVTRPSHLHIPDQPHSRGCD